MFQQQKDQGKVANRLQKTPDPQPPFAGLERQDYILLAAMWLLTYPVFKLAKLPYVFDLGALTTAYWMMPVGAIFVAIVLGILGLPFKATILPLLKEISKNKVALLVFIPLALMLCVFFGITFGTVVFVDALGLVELLRRNQKELRAKLLDLLVPAVYLFIGLIAVFAYNHAIVGIRYGGTEDRQLNSLDYTIFKTHVYSIASWSFNHLPNWVFRIFDFVYFSIWSRFGAALVLVSVLGSRRDAIRFVRTILVCYALALLVFAMVPGKGPYSISKVHWVDYPRDLASYTTQAELVERIKKLYAHTLTDDVREVGIGDYYISFPSLHAALPILAIWFLRRWRRIQMISASIYFLLLLPALVFLGWHYFVDILGGWGVAVLSIGITEMVSRPPIAFWSRQPVPCTKP